MAIQNRRGNEADFLPGKMLPGEFAVSMDQRKLYLCFSSGVVRQVALTEDLASEISALSSTLSGRISTLETNGSDQLTRIIALEGRATTDEASLLNHNTRLNTIEGSIQTISNTASTANTKADTNAGEIAQLKTRATTIEGNVSTNTASISTINGQIQTIQGEQTTQNTAIAGAVRFDMAQPSLTNAQKQQARENIGAEDQLTALRDDLGVLEPTATASDVGKTLKVKTVSGGKVTEYEFGSAGVPVDSTFSHSGEAADAKKVGDEIFYEIAGGYSQLTYESVADEYVKKDGDTAYFPNWTRSARIPINGFTEIYFDNGTSETAYNCLYDSNGSFVSNFSIPANANKYEIDTTGCSYIIISQTTAAYGNIKIYSIGTTTRGIKDVVAETVRFTQQSLTDSQKAQARENIGVSSGLDLDLSVADAGKAITIGSDLGTSVVDLGIRTTKPKYEHLEYEKILNSYPTLNGFESYTGWWRSDYIEINPQYGFFYSLVRTGTSGTVEDNVFYDTNKNPISKFTLSETLSLQFVQDVIPSSAKYMIISGSNKGGDVDQTLTVINNYTGLENGSVVPFNTKLQDGYFEYSYETIQNEYIDTSGNVVSYNGWWRSDYIPVNSNGFYYIIDGDHNSNEANVYNAFYDENKGYISSFSLIRNAGLLLFDDIPLNAAYMAISNKSGASEHILLYSLYNGSDGAPDIIKYNKDVVDNIKYSRLRIDDQTTLPLTLLHFSDIHGHGAELLRILQFANYLGNKIDNIVCTGDMMYLYYTSDYTFWTGAAGSGNILTCIGNHDVNSRLPYSDYGDGITQQMAYDKYFAPYIANWGVTYTSGKTYYYKDYATYGVRLIALDVFIGGSEIQTQNTWLQTTLAGAKSNGYTVVVIEHRPVHHKADVSCGFNMPYNHWDSEYGDTETHMDTYQATIQDFIDDGGKFACILCGHTHYDKVMYNTNYPSQLCFAVTAAYADSYCNDQVREIDTKTMDAFNIVMIDTEQETIKLLRVGANKDNYLRPRNIMTISYATKQIITDY